MVRNEQRDVVLSPFATVGEVCGDGAERLRDGEHGLPDGRDDGQTRSSRLLSGGCHGQGEMMVKSCFNVCKATFSNTKGVAHTPALTPFNT